MTTSEIDTLFNDAKISDGFSMRLAVGQLIKGYLIPKNMSDLIEDIAAEAFILGFKKGLENKSEGYL